MTVRSGWADSIVLGDARRELQEIPDESIDLSFWSPPYYVGKSYERGMTFQDWRDLIEKVIVAHSRIV